MATPVLQPGSLLVATRALLDPNFADSVVLLLDVNDEGALGVVLNRPSPVPVSEVIDGWQRVVVDPDVLFQGGPVSVDGALAVACLAVPGHEPVGFRSVCGPLGVIDLDTPVELLAGSLAAMRVFAGYAGWGPGQLQDEVDEGSWYVVTSELEDVFVADPTGLRRTVLRRQPGELAWHSTRPFDPELN